MIRTKNHQKPAALLTALLLSVLLLGACSPSTPQPAPTIDTNEILTQAAATVGVEMTRVAGLTPSPAPATATTAPTNTPGTAVTSEVQPTQPAAAQPTSTRAQPAVTAPAGNAPDAAGFVDDITIPDGTAANPGAKFVKTWRIKNTGTTTWTTTYALVYLDGERMDAPDSIPMPKEVAPNETVDISVTLTAPSQPGSYKTFFRLRNAAGQFFRLDTSGDLWVQISVGGGSTATVAPSATATP
jgi:hypothetical protein